MKDSLQSIIRISPALSQNELVQAVSGMVGHSFIGDAEFFDEALCRLRERFGSQVYAEFFRALFHVQIEEETAEDLFAKIIQFHKEMEVQLNSKLDFRVSSLQYLISVEKKLLNPVIMEAQHYEKIFHDTVTDELTGLFNARYFRTCILREVDRASRQKEPLSLIFFDLDLFKKMNDECGHSAGDEVLKLFAQAVLSSIRSTDFPCRYGGDEFAIIVPHTPKEGARRLAMRVRDRFLDLQKKVWKSTRISIGVSGGVAVFPEDANQAENLLKKADEALYLAKQEGKDRIEVLTSDRRRHPRKDVIASAIHINAINRPQVVIRNVSESGVLVQASEPVEEGAIIELQMELDHLQSPIQLMGKVAHVKEETASKSYFYGVSILAMQPKDQAAFRRIIGGQHT